jgi:hypothetical protein
MLAELLLPHHTYAIVLLSLHYCSAVAGASEA